MMAAAVSAEPTDKKVSKKNPAVSLAGTAWELKYAGAREEQLRLYHFNAAGNFYCRSVRGVFIYNNWARWKAKGESFEVVVPRVDWRAEGRFTNQIIRGTVTADGKRTAFQGRRVDPKTYEFPLLKGEVIVTVKLRQYALEELPEAKKFDDYLKKGEGSNLKGVDKWRIAGFIFEVVAPKKHQGKYITAHHDGILASGDPTEIAVPGKTYLLRINKRDIGKKDFGLCSIDLRIKRPSDKRALGPYRRGIYFSSK
jgi:hypothetical protein